MKLGQSLGALRSLQTVALYKADVPWEACRSAGLVDLNKGHLSDNECTVLAQALRMNTALIGLKMDSPKSSANDDSGNTFSATGLKEIQLSLTQMKHLGELSFNNCTKIGPDGAAVLCESLSTLMTLTRLHVANCMLNTAGATAISNLLKANPSIADIDLCSNSIGSSGASAIAEALSCHGTVMKINLSDNDVAANGMTALAEGLRRCPSIQTLRLSENPTAAEGATAIASAVKCATELTILELNGVRALAQRQANRIEMSGAMALAEAWEELRQGRRQRLGCQCVGVGVVDPPLCEVSIDCLMT